MSRCRTTLQNRTHYNESLTLTDHSKERLRMCQNNHEFPFPDAITRQYFFSAMVGYKKNHQQTMTKQNQINTIALSIKIYKKSKI